MVWGRIREQISYEDTQRIHAVISAALSCWSEY